MRKMTERQAAKVANPARRGLMPMRVALAQMSIVGKSYRHKRGTGRLLEAVDVVVAPRRTMVLLADGRRVVGPADDLAVVLCDDRGHPRRVWMEHLLSDYAVTP